MVDYAEIKIWGELVGAVRWFQDRNLASFQYDTKFLSKGWDISPIKMPIKNGNRTYSFPELRPTRGEDPNTFKGLPGLLSDALPDKYGNELINVWLAQRGRPANSMNPVEQLCFIGSRGMGALEFEKPLFPSEKRAVTFEIKSLVDVAQEILSQREGFSTNLKEDDRQAISDIIKVGTSAGGARAKAVIAYNAKTGEVKSGQAKAPKGFEHWLIKLDGVKDSLLGDSNGFGRVEYAYHLMAKICGIDMMECQLFKENGRAHFMTKRFDREGHDTKHHIQTFCGIQHFDYTKLYSYSYEQLFQTMRTLKLTYPEAEQMFRRMVFNVMATNYDDHTKNFSFRLKKDGKWELSPAYDVCYSYDPKNPWVNQHTLSINGKYLDITKSDLMTIATANNIKKGEKIIDEIKAVVCNWHQYAEDVEVEQKLRDTITKTLIALK
jgi:serine/threonine-protein kinase HipA